MADANLLLKSTGLDKWDADDKFEALFKALAVINPLVKVYKDQYYSLWKVTVFLASREAPFSDDEMAEIIPSPRDCCEMDRIPFVQ